MEVVVKNDKHPIILLQLMNICTDSLKQIQLKNNKLKILCHIKSHHMGEKMNSKDSGINQKGG
jgi:hypothetical protein